MAISRACISLSSPFVAQPPTAKARASVSDINNRLFFIIGYLLYLVNGIITSATKSHTTHFKNNPASTHLFWLSLIHRSDQYTVYFQINAHAFRRGLCLTLDIERAGENAMPALQ
jgi:hypothetical protein